MALEQTEVLLAIASMIYHDIHSFPCSSLQNRLQPKRFIAISSIPAKGRSKISMANLGCYTVPEGTLLQQIFIDWPHSSLVRSQYQTTSALEFFPNYRRSAPKLVRISSRRDKLRPIRLYHRHNSGIAFSSVIAVCTRECDILRCIFRTPDSLDLPGVRHDISGCDFDGIAYVVDENVHRDALTLDSSCRIDRWASEQSITVELRGVVEE